MLRLRYPLYQMASFSRSGETLVLRTLAAHPDVQVVHQLLEPDDPADLSLFRALARSSGRWVWAFHPSVRRRGAGTGSVFILKNAVWLDRTPRPGFILVRNPLAVIASTRVHRRESEEHHRAQALRWCRTIDPQMVPEIGAADILDAFCLLYRRKMLAHHGTGLPIVRYEDFVTDTEAVLRPLLDHLGLPWDGRVLRAHQGYRDGQFGHGRIPLWKAINPHSLDKYRSLPRGAVDRVLELTGDVMTAYGYSWAGGRVVADPAFDLRFRPSGIPDGR